MVSEVTTGVRDLPIVLLGKVDLLHVMMQGWIIEPLILSTSMLGGSSHAHPAHPGVKEPHFTWGL